MVVLLLLLAPTAVSAQSAANPMDWLTGCWRMTRGATTVEERWSDMQGGLMLGTSRTIRAGRAVEYEFSRITLAGDSLAFHAQPSGQAPATFVATTRTTDSVVFANPLHDFPKAVVYKRTSGDSVHAWVEGGGRRFDFRYARMPC